MTSTTASSQLFLELKFYTIFFKESYEMGVFSEENILMFL